MVFHGLSPERIILLTTVQHVRGGLTEGSHAAEGGTDLVLVGVILLIDVHKWLGCLVVPNCL